MRIWSRRSFLASTGLAAAAMYAPAFAKSAPDTAALKPLIDAERQRIREAMARLNARDEILKVAT